MFKDLLERFRRVFTRKQLNEATQEALRNKEFVLEGYFGALRRVEKSENEMTRDRVHERQPNMSNPMMGYQGGGYSVGNQRPSAQPSLKELMDAIRHQQQFT